EVGRGSRCFQASPAPGNCSGDKLRRLPRQSDEAIWKEEGDEQKSKADHGIETIGKRTGEVGNQREEHRADKRTLEVDKTTKHGNNEKVDRPRQVNRSGRDCPIVPCSQDAS